MWEERLADLLLWHSEGHVSVIVLCLLPVCHGLVYSVIVAFPGHTHLLFNIKRHSPSILYLALI